MIPPVHFYLVAAYTVGIPLFQAAWGHRTKIKSPLFKPVMLVYNLALAAFSAWCFLVSLQAVQKLPLYGNDCGLWFSPQNSEWALAVNLFTWSKYVEFSDTLFLVLNGKDASWLHYLHHIGAPLNMAGLEAGKNEAVIYFIGLNSCIHTLMYLYYGTCIVYKDSKLLKRLKPLMTSMQIVQFFTGFVGLYFYIDVPCFYASKEHMALYWYTYLYVGLVLCLFLNFYLQNYFAGASKGAGKSSTKGGKKEE